MVLGTSGRRSPRWPPSIDYAYRARPFSHAQTCDGTAAAASRGGNQRSSRARKQKHSHPFPSFHFSLPPSLPLAYLIHTQHACPLNMSLHGMIDTTHSMYVSETKTGRRTACTSHTPCCSRAPCTGAPLRAGDKTSALRFERPCRNPRTGTAPRWRYCCFVAPGPLQDRKPGTCVAWTRGRDGRAHTGGGAGECFGVSLVLVHLPL